MGKGKASWRSSGLFGLGLCASTSQGANGKVIVRYAPSDLSATISYHPSYNSSSLIVYTWCPVVCLLSFSACLSALYFGVIPKLPGV